MKKAKTHGGCYAFAIDKQGEVLKGSTVTIAQAKQKGWYNRDGSNWLADPEQMLRYRAATRFQTAYCPELSCGLATKEELEDADYTEITSDNVDQLSAEEKLAQTQEKEQKEANSQTMGMNTGSKTTIPQELNRQQMQAHPQTNLNLWANKKCRIYSSSNKASNLQ